MASPYNQTFLANQLRSDSFLPFGFGDAADRRNRVEAAAQRSVRPEVLALLQAQNEALPPSAARLANLEALRRPGTVVAISGQQVGLLLGPLYTVYKAATAVVVSRLLQAETGRCCVPLFWLQTEDHDFAEIASALTWRPQGPLRLTLSDDPALERCSVAQRRLPADVAAVLAPLAETLEPLPHGAEVLAMIREAYAPGRTLAEAFARLLGGLFAEEGLLLFDPRSKVVARLAAPLLRRSITERADLEALLATRAEALRAAGFTEQVHLRPGSPLAFFHLDRAEGPRYRLDAAGEGFTLPTAPPGLISEAELLQVLETDPQRFSTSALLRPLLQDTLFPTAAYVGGPAEVGYFAQMMPLYGHFGLEPPLVVPRARFRLLLPQTRRVLEVLGLTASEAERPLSELTQQLTTALLPAEQAPGEAWLAEVEARLGGFEQIAEVLDPGLYKAVERTRNTLRRAVGRLGRGAHRVAASKDSILSERLARLSGALYPDGAPQERSLCFAAFAAAVGPGQLVQTILGTLEPLKPLVKEVSL